MNDRRLFVWTKFAPDYTEGLAFAVAETTEQAHRLVIEHLGYEPSDWGRLYIYPIRAGIAFAVPGGGAR